MSGDEARRRAFDEADSHEPVIITDKRRIDPDTGEVREPASAPRALATEVPTVSEESQNKAAELIADLQRVQADFANYRKRSLRDQQVASERAKAHVVGQLLPILDDLDRARAHGDLETGPLKAVADKLVSTLQGMGLSGFGDEGEEFDPQLHEAVQHEGEGTHPVVGSVMRRGYKVGDQVIRHAMVGVVDTVPDADTVGETADNPDAAAAQAAESDN